MSDTGRDPEPGVLGKWAAEVVARRPWLHLHFWVAAAIIVAFATAIPSGPSGAFLCIAITLAVGWTWDAIAAWTQQVL